MSWRDRLQTRHQNRLDQQLWRNRNLLSGPQGRFVEIDGQSLLNFCSNDYLGLANHATVKNAACEATRRWGAGSGASHLVCGHFEIHEQLENELASFVGAERAIVFSTGYMANLSLPQTFLDRHGLLLEDKLNHASLIDAGQLCAAKLKRYPHLDDQCVERWLTDSDVAQKMVMTDGVFSMDGDIANVRRLEEICRIRDAILVVDEAHGLGVLGDRGGGCLQANGIAVRDNILVMGTLGKSLGSFGAFVAGDSQLIESLIQFARPYIYTTALPPGVVGAAIGALEVLPQQRWRIEKLQKNIDHLQKRAKQADVRIMASETAIQPIVVGSVENAIDLSAKLRDSGILVVAIRPPTVPVGTSRLRITLTSDHEFEDIDRLIGSLSDFGISAIFGEAAK